MDTVDGVAYFVTPSWSGKDETYEILFDLKTRMVRCNCFGSNRWGLYTDLANLEASGGCRHSREVARMILSQVRNEQ